MPKFDIEWIAEVSFLFLKLAGLPLSRKLAWRFVETGFDTIESKIIDSI